MMRGIPTTGRLRRRKFSIIPSSYPGLAMDITTSNTSHLAVELNPRAEISSIIGSSAQHIERNGESEIPNMSATLEHSTATPRRHLTGSIMEIRSGVWRNSFATDSGVDPSQTLPHNQSVTRLLNFISRKTRKLPNKNSAPTSALSTCITTNAVKTTPYRDALPTRATAENTPPAAELPAARSSLSVHWEDNHEDQIPDLTTRIQKLDRHPVFEGTYSSVYKGVYNEQLVAIKVIRGVNHVRSMRRKMRRERMIWWQLEHPNILPLYGIVDSEEWGTFGALISPWCEHGTVADHLTKRLSPLQRINLFWGIANGLQYLHSFKPTVVHGDLKPPNILVDRHYNAILCDFGLVRLIHDQSSTGMTTTSAHTGTARYLAYELVESEQPLPTTASDVHALGCIGMELTHLHPPYAHIQSNYSAQARIYLDIGTKVPPAKRPDGLDDVLSDLWDMFEDCWNIYPQKRPTADAVCQYILLCGMPIMKSLSH